MTQIILVKGHTQSPHYFFRTVRNYVAFLHVNRVLASVQMGQRELKSSQRFQQTDVLLHEQVGTLPRENLVFLFLCDQYQVSCKCLWNLVSFPCDRNWCVVWNTPFQGDFYGFFLFKDFLPIACLAFTAFCDDLPFSLAFVAVFLHLLIHTRTHLVHLDDDTLAFAGFAFLYAFSALSAALLAASGSRMLQFLNFAVVNIFKCDVECFFGGLDFGFLLPPSGSSTPSPATKQFSEIDALIVWIR